MEQILIECNKGRPIMFRGSTERAAKNKLAKWINSIAKEQEEIDAPADFRINMKLSDDKFDRELYGAMELLGWHEISFDYY